MALRLAIDTNRYTDLARGEAVPLAAVQRAEQVWMPFVVLGELRAGFAYGKRTADNERNLQRFLAQERVDVLYPDESTTRHYAQIFVQLREQGTPIPVNDLWIAALVVQHGLHLLARDKHFDHLPQLPRV